MQWLTALLLQTCSLHAGPGGEEVPAVWVDRTGMKVGITEQYSRQSKGTLALVAQASACRASGLLAEWSESQRRRRW